MPASPTISRLATLVGVALLVPRADAFVPAGTGPADSRWQSTASGPTGLPGDPVTLTWSFIPDGTNLFDSDSTSLLPSDLISRLDSEIGAGPGGSDYTLRPWFHLFEKSFNRWAALSGLTFVYEPNDDGQRHGSEDGVLGVRGDLRIGGAGLDGAGGTLAYNYFPADGGDMALDTDDFINLFVDPANDYRYLRNTIMHEAGHGIGIDHTNSSDAAFLMEPSINTDFDGPQHDDLRGAHWLYGDAFEKAPAGRNETAAFATPLGPLAAGGTLSIGAGGTGTVVGPTEIDFVSISNENDIDFFAFTIDSPLTLAATMTPRGATFEQGSTFVTTETSDLSLAIFDTDGATLLGESAGGAAGVTETVAGLSLAQPGTYYARVRGPLEAIGQVTQFYQLDLAASAFVVPLEGDFNADGLVDAADYTLWRDTLDLPVAPFTGADHSGNGTIDNADYTLWLANFGQTLGGGSLAVPEPMTAVLCLLGVAYPSLVGRRSRRA